MTQEEFDKTAFRKGDKVRIDEGVFEIMGAVFDSLCTTPIRIEVNTCSKWLRLTEILEYIPVEVEDIKKKQTVEERNAIWEQGIIKKIAFLKTCGYRVQKKTETWEDC